MHLYFSVLYDRLTVAFFFLEKVFFFLSTCGGKPRKAHPVGKAFVWRLGRGMFNISILNELGMTVLYELNQNGAYLKF